MTTWHAAPEVLTQFAAAPALLDDVTASSIEAHLLGCDQCRRGVAQAAAASAPDDAVALRSWDGIADRIDRPRPSLAERVLGWILPSDVARLVAATAALRVSWLAAVTAVVAAVVVVARQAGSEAPLLALAPLVPLAGIAASFGPAADPAGEAALATPLHGAGLILRRAAAVLLTSLVVLLAGTLALPGLELADLAWVLPALGLTLAALALSTWVAPYPATSVAGAAWVAAVYLVTALDRPQQLAEGPLFGPASQLAFAALAVLAAGAIRARRMQLSTLEAR